MRNSAEAFRALCGVTESATDAKLAERLIELR